MTEHYYTKQPMVKSDPHTVRVIVRGIEIQLKTDNGIFSKKGLDYGTRLLIETVELPNRAHAVDLGCGYGPVSSVLASIYTDSRWTLLDINERAVLLAKENTSKYNERMSYYVSDGFSAVPNLQSTTILLNPPIRAGKETIYRLFSESKEHLQEGGMLWVVMQKKQGAPSAKEFLSMLFPEVTIEKKKSGYYIFCCKK